MQRLRALQLRCIAFSTGSLCVAVCANAGAIIIAAPITTAATLLLTR